jgi:phycocyanin-associated rod protein
MKVSAGSRGTGVNSVRQVSIVVTGVNNNDYSRTADMVMNVPFSRMNETMQLVNAMGGKITKYLDEEDGLRKWTCGFYGKVRKGWNATKALGHMIGGGQQCQGL